MNIAEKELRSACRRLTNGYRDHVETHGYKGTSFSPLLSVRYLGIGYDYETHHTFIHLPVCDGSARMIINRVNIGVSERPLTYAYVAQRIEHMNIELD